MVGAVLFDFGGTLDSDGTRWAERHFLSYRAAGGQTGFKAFEASFLESDHLLGLLPGISELGLREMVEIQVALLRGHLQDGWKVDAEAWSHEFQNDSIRIAARNRPMLDWLHQSYDLGVVSNFTGNLRPCLAELGLEDCFDVVLDSGTIGIRKPNPRLFHAAFDALGRVPEECWMVGDNPFADILPAARLGCRTCWLGPESRVLPDGITPTSRISSLTEFPALVA